MKRLILLSVLAASAVSPVSCKKANDSYEVLAEADRADSEADFCMSLSQRIETTTTRTAVSSICHENTPAARQKAFALSNDLRIFALPKAVMYPTFAVWAAEAKKLMGVDLKCGQVMHKMAGTFLFLSPEGYLKEGEGKGEDCPAPGDFHAMIDQYATPCEKNSDVLTSRQAVGTPFGSATLCYSPAHAETAGLLRDSFPQAVVRASSFFNNIPVQMGGFSLLIPDSPSLMGELTGSAYQSWFKGSANSRSMAISPKSWYGGRNIDDLFELNRFREMIQHEAIHVIHHQQTAASETLERWLAEGMAVYGSGQPLRYGSESFNRCLDQTKALRDLQNEVSGVKCEYAAAGAFLHYLDEVYGRSTVIKVMKEASAGSDVAAITNLSENQLVDRFIQWAKSPDRMSR